MLRRATLFFLLSRPEGEHERTDRTSDPARGWYWQVGTVVAARAGAWADRVSREASRMALDATHNLAQHLEAGTDTRARFRSFALDIERLARGIYRRGADGQALVCGRRL